MSHGPVLNIDIDEVITSGPITPAVNLQRIFWGCIGVGFFTFLLGLVKFPAELLWGAYYTNLVFFMGLACGGVMITPIIQIVRAKWAPPIRRLAEANIVFLPWAFIGLMLTYFGRNELFPWGHAPMPGREWWMQPSFVYFRFAVLFLLLFWLMYRYVSLSIRSDLGCIREDEKYRDKWQGGWLYAYLTRDWAGSDVERLQIQRKLSCSGPVLVIAYVLIYSLFAFEMIMGMDTIWYSNMFGGFYFVGNIYLGLAVTTLLMVFYIKKSPAFARTIETQQFWDIGKLTFGFSMLWGYLFFSQYLPQWYGNLPEATHWLLLRARGLWMPLTYATIGMCFVMPFIWLLSEDIKKTPSAYASVCIVIFFGVWLEKYVTIMPQLSPNAIPLLSGGILEVGLFFGFLGVYGLCIQNFMKRFPFTPVSHPLTTGSIDW